MQDYISSSRLQVEELHERRALFQHSEKELDRFYDRVFFGVPDAALTTSLFATASSAIEN
jgi:hypothetical protein